MQLKPKQMTSGIARRTPSVGEHGTLASISRSGKIAAFRRRGAVELCHLDGHKRVLIDTDSAEPAYGQARSAKSAKKTATTTINSTALANGDGGTPVDFGFGIGGFWLLANQLIHWMSEEGVIVHEAVVGPHPVRLQPARATLPSCILSDLHLTTPPSAVTRNVDTVDLYNGQLFAFPLLLGSAPNEQLFPIGPRLVCVAGPGSLRVTHLERGTLFEHALPPGTTVRGLAPVLDDSGLAVVLSGQAPQVWLLNTRGTRLITVPCPRPDQIAIAEARGVVVIANHRTLCSIDLTDPRSIRWAETPFSIHSMDICAQGKEMVFARIHGKSIRCWQARYSTVFAKKVPSINK